MSFLLDPSLTYFKENLDIREHLRELPNIALGLWSIGIVYGKLNDPSNALQNLDHSLEMYERLGLKNYAERVVKLVQSLSLKNKKLI